MYRFVLVTLLSATACQAPTATHVGVYVSRDELGMQAISLEPSGRFQFLITNKGLPQGTVLVGGSYIVVRDTMYFRSDVAINAGVSLAPIRGDSLFWTSGTAGQVFVREPAAH